MGPLRLALQYVLSVIFIVQMYLSMLVVAVLYLPWMILSREGALAGGHAFSRWVVFSARVLVGIKTEVRGTPPSGQVLVASKHQSFMDIIMIFAALPRPRFIMKRELIYAPLLGQYALRMGCIPVDRGKKGTAIKKMLAKTRSGQDIGGQLVIFPQGTRVAPGVEAPYKAGTAALYRELGQPCVPAATNVGVFWPRHGILRKPGTAVIEFLPEIPPGLRPTAFMNELERVVETRSNELMAEALSQT